jgi:anaerobic magnesium-protoporphyrin IX monomethyl ester cyclase
MKPLWVFVRPPRPLWPLNGPSTAFWPPLAFASLSAALREHVPGLQVAIIDAPALRMGWETLARHLRSLGPEYVGIGEEAVSCVEGIRIAKLARQLGAKVIAGGCFFSHTAREVLSSGVADVVVHGEGEQTVVELAEAMQERDPKALRSVAGISFRDGEEIVFTGWRELLPHLDLLPFPAYDLLPMERYGAMSRHHPQFASLESSRGCSHGCQFCVLWRQMGRFHAGRHAPCLRVKSPERLLEEIRLLMNKFGRRYLGWVDPCFNADPHVHARLAELLFREDRIIGQSAWVRADYVLRDDASGALKLCYDSGWNEAYIGIERMERADLEILGKGNLNGETGRAVRLLHARYPRLITFGSFIYGMPWDTPHTVRAMFHAAEQLPMDQTLFIPLTPLPGTPFWHSEMWDPSGEGFRSFDFIPHAGKDDTLTRLSSEIARSYLLRWSPQRLGRMFAGLLDRDSRRRGITWNLLRRTLPVMVSVALQRNPKSSCGMVFPAWYEG